ncbi:MAG TPA: lytic transglycosylase domain-containing protein [Flavisolibacter sp.]|nr:lytic transglycosylase domain-containing protein [Flavisolibacter sp.]
MNKLLLLATSLFCLNLEGYAETTPQQAGAPSDKVAIKDSSIKEAERSDPKDAFKDLFESETSIGVNGAKLNPKAVSFVQDYMETEGSRLEKMKDWGKPFFDKINTIFLSHALPVELKYLAVIESDLKTSATSRVGAAGPWQFMAGTARDLGLKVNRSVDERRDFNKSTKAAARYLSDLYEIYSDWLLVIAAYNGGPGNVNAAIRKSGSRNFWDLQYHLPAESRNHVKKFIATHYIMEGNAGLTTLTKNETEALMVSTVNITDAPANTTTMKVTGKYNSQAITQTIAMDANEFRKLNPDFDRQLSANGSYELRLPDNKMTLFQANKPQILEQSVRLMMEMR